MFGQESFTGTGSGFILTADGYVLTNHHVIDGAQSITVTLSDGTEYTAQLVGSDSVSDVALLKIDGQDLPAVSIGNSDDLEVGDQVAAIGNPWVSSLPPRPWAMSAPRTARSIPTGPSSICSRPMQPSIPATPVARFSI